MATKTRQLADYLVVGGLSDQTSDIEVRPHIKPGVLYPAVANIMLDGSTALSASTVGPNSSTVTSSKYGTVQSDGRMYYYTDIKGSKPIRDPRIGAHFGVQRHEFKSIQLLEDVSATHGLNVFSVDGREWIRAVNALSSDQPDKISVTNGGQGNYIAMNASNCFFEVTGYFNDMHWSQFVSATRKVRYTLDGGTEVATDFGYSGKTTPYDHSRFSTTGSVEKFGISTTLGIHTVKIRRNAGDAIFANGLELVAQDTTSSATRVKIQIPAQNVVSYGKKFALSAAAHHYDPFNTMSYGGSGTTASALGDLIDTGTSLGMENWKAGGDNFHRPFNGGRVVKWIGSDGTIKTSVTMMPPNAQNMTTTASNAISNAEVIAGTNTEQINFDTTAIDHSLNEVARTFSFVEFGNGGANGNTSWKDASSPINQEVSGGYDWSFVMTDGLTCHTSRDGKSVPSQAGFLPGDPGDWGTTTFIGTGVSYRLAAYDVGFFNCVMNAPYGTHCVRNTRAADGSADSEIKFDGIDIGDLNGDGHGSWGDITFYQPKKPPVPEDACIIADYMLMADWVNQHTGNQQGVSKGARWQAIDRDVWWNTGHGTNNALTTNNADPDNYRHKWVDVQSHADTEIRLPSFATIAQATGFNMHGDDPKWKVNHPGGEFHNNGTVTGSSNTNSQTIVGGGSGVGSPTFELGNNKWRLVGTTTGAMNIDGFFYNIPTHTSHHYQPFESEFLKELVGGDRNMEQQNLIVTADGKTWDEVTRDTSYQSTTVLQVTRDGNDYDGTADQKFIFTQQRGGNTKRQMINKGHFAYIYDRFICLKSGFYKVTMDGVARTGATAGQIKVRVNGDVQRIGEFGPSSGRGQHISSHTMNLNRLDYIEIQGDDLESNQADFYCYLHIEKLEKDN